MDLRSTDNDPTARGSTKVCSRAAITAVLQSDLAIEQLKDICENIVLSRLHSTTQLQRIDSSTSSPPSKNPIGLRAAPGYCTLFARPGYSLLHDVYLPHLPLVLLSWHRTSGSVLPPRKVPTCKLFCPSRHSKVANQEMSNRAQDPGWCGPR